MNFSQRLLRAVRRQLTLPNRLGQVQEALGRIEARLNASKIASDPRDFEFKVYSQWGEDGIIDHLVTHMDIPNKSFVEFGVETYTEANTVFLLKHRNWRGLVIDGSTEHIAAIRSSTTFWKYGLMAECAFITKDNINDLIRKSGLAGDIGILSVDIDGNDYWVWQAIDVVQPRIVIAEYNSLFGPTAPISTPYRADFYRTQAHGSNMYYGASIAALTHLATMRGYSLVAGNSAGNNVFFVRSDVKDRLQTQSVEQAYVQAAFREARSSAGEVEHLDFSSRQKAIGHLPVTNVVTGQTVALRDAL